MQTFLGSSAWVVNMELPPTHTHTHPTFPQLSTGTWGHAQRGNMHFVLLVGGGWSSQNRNRKAETVQRRLDPEGTAMPRLSHGVR